jgi:prepilin-type N-terminal cleavage/methylation domain-containing protein
MRRGFTLIECIVATFILAIGFVAVASLYPMAYRGATVSANHVAAMEIASGLLAHIRSSPYGNPVGSPFIDPESLTVVIEDAPTVVTFKKSITFARGGTHADLSANADVATVTVTWTEGTGPASEGISKRVTLTGGVCREP